MLSTAGNASRRAGEVLMRQGRVTLNGAVVRELGVQADAARDVILIDGARLPPPGPRRTIVLHKPRGIVSTQDDPEGRPTVRTLLGGSERRLYPLGRRDVHTTGPLVLGTRPPGGWRDLTPGELQALRRAAGLSRGGAAASARPRRVRGTSPKSTPPRPASPPRAGGHAGGRPRAAGAPPRRSRAR